MIINFESIIDQSGQKQKFSFAANLEISKYNEFDVYEFDEPSKKERNRIEISSDKINIMAGPSTIELELDKEIAINYQIQGAGLISFTTLLHSLEKNDDNIKFNYSLYNNNKEVGRYYIQLTIKK